MSLKQYRAFLKTVECRSVSQAAQAMGMTQSALTQNLGALEKQFGFRLLVRNKAGVRLTQEGRRVYRAIEQVVRADEALQSAVEEVRRSGGDTIRIATFKSVAVSWLPAMMKAFQAEHPDMIPVKEDRLLAVLPQGHPLAETEAVPAAQFGREAVVSLVDSTNRDALRVLRAAGVEPRIRFQTADDYAMISMVETGLGICITHELVLKSDNHNVVVKELDPPATRTIAVAIPNYKEARPIVRQFIEFVKEWTKHE